MTKERESNMLKLVTSNETDIKPSEVKLPEVENKVYQSNPVKSDLYSKLLAFRQSQKKFNVQDLIRDSLK
ncbi:MAG: hypothetical protein NC200_07120 [Candidatus Gastranaerophilales bacterium]|nr:hypothetical protein [Candidatus Gastranaerophilales bacterium]